jgi:hypothetical protein
MTPTRTTALRERRRQDLQVAGLSARTQEAYLRRDRLSAIIPRKSSPSGKPVLIVSSDQRWGRRTNPTRFCTVQ